MARRNSGKMHGEQYLGDISTAKIHDLDNEQAACGISKVIEGGFEAPFSSLQEARKEGYESGLHISRCPYCFGGTPDEVEPTPKPKKEPSFAL